jgi:hypothetical protein
VVLRPAKSQNYILIYCLFNLMFFQYFEILSLLFDERMFQSFKEGYISATICDVKQVSLHL